MSTAPNASPADTKTASPQPSPAPEGWGFALPEDPAVRDRLAELGQLAGGLVHEIKNPLGAIDLTIQMLLQSWKRGDLGEHAKTEARLERIAAGTRQLLRIATDFLAFARPGRPDRERVDLNDLIASIVEEQRELFDADDIAIVLHPEASLSAVPADLMQLRIVLLNIVLNAREALLRRTEGRRLVIATRNRPGRIVVVLANNGPSLSARAAARLFEPFFSEKEDGSGLGLAIVRRLVELHQGSVSVHSDPAQGVSFTIELPTSLGPAKPHAELPQPEHPADAIDS